MSRPALLPPFSTIKKLAKRKIIGYFLHKVPAMIMKFLCLISKFIILNLKQDFSVSTIIEGRKLGWVFCSSLESLSFTTIYSTAEEEESYHKEGLMMTSCSILIIDDVAQMRQLLEQIAGSLQLNCFSAENETTALKIAKNHKNEIGLVLLDINLNNTKGIDLIHKLKEELIEAKYCFISGLKDKDTIMKAIHSGGDDYVVKPIDISIMKGKIKSLLKLGAEDEFKWAEVNFEAQLKNSPIEVNFMIKGISETGIKFKSQIPLKINSKIEISSEQLSQTIGIDSDLDCMITKECNGENLFTAKFFGLHENTKQKIRSYTVKSIN